MENQVEEQRKIHHQQMSLKIKRIVWNFLLVLIVGCLAVSAIEGIGLRQRIPYYNPSEPREVFFYYVQMFNLTRLSTINDYYNHLLGTGGITGSNGETLLLAHDTYTLLVAGISIIFLSALIPLLSLLNQKSMSDKGLIATGRIFSGIGWLLVLVGAIVFVTKTVTIINDVNYPTNPWQPYRSFSEIFDTGAIAGLFILIGISGIGLLLPTSWKSWALNYQPNQTSQQFAS